MLLGEIAKEEGKIEEALRSFDQAAAILEKKHRPAIPGLNFQRGDALARMGQAAQADTLEVKWPSGQVDGFSNVKANTFYVITEGARELQFQRISSAPADGRVAPAR